MTHRSTWKKAEGKLAKELGTRRTPLSGINSGHTSSDTLHKKFYLELKYRNRIPFYKTFEDVKIKAKKEGKIPIMVLKMKRKRETIMFMSLETFKSLIEKQNKKGV